MGSQRCPTGLGAAGRRLWVDVSEANELDATQRVLLEEACRAKDRLDKLDELLRGDTDVWARLVHDLRTEDYELKVDSALAQANATANLLKQLVASLRLPDQVSGKRPQQRGGGRGAYQSGAGSSSGKVSSLDRARAAKSGA